MAWSSSLVLGTGQGGPRYFLGERPVSGGDIVKLGCAGGWITGRFEWDPGMDTPPRFHFSIELDGGGVAEQSIELPDRALLRWP